MNKEGKATIGVVVLLFGISWIAYANVQPAMTTGACATSNQAPFSCLDYAATVFYPPGFLALVVSILLLGWELLPGSPSPSQGREETTRTGLKGGRAQCTSRPNTLESILERSTLT